MPKLILFILLLTVVYSWEEFKHAVLVLWYRFRRQNKTHSKKDEPDQIVSDILIMATIPISLAYLLFASGSIFQKLIITLLEIIVLSLIVRGWEEFRRRRHFTRHYQGPDIYIGHAFSFLGLISPAWQFASKTIKRPNRTAGFLSTLILPLGFGLILAFSVRQMGDQVLQAHLDLLIIIAVLGLVMNLTIEVLEKMFRNPNLRHSGLLRILLGILIILALQVK